MLAVVARGFEDASVVVRLRALRSGATTLQVRASGLRAWLRVDVLTRAGVTEVAALEAAGDTAPVDLPIVRCGNWFAGGRLNLTKYDYRFGNQSLIAGRWGVFAEGYAGRALPSGIRLMAGVSGGTLEADSAGASILVALVEVYARMEYSFRPEAPVHPVASCGAGLYRARTGGGTGAGRVEREPVLDAGGGRGLLRCRRGSWVRRGSGRTSCTTSARPRRPRGVVVAWGGWG